MAKQPDSRLNIIIPAVAVGLVFLAIVIGGVIAGILEKRKKTKELERLRTAQNANFIYRPEQIGSYPEGYYSAQWPYRQYAIPTRYQGYPDYRNGGDYYRSARYANGTRTYEGRKPRPRSTGEPYYYYRNEGGPKSNGHKRRNENGASAAHYPPHLTPDDSFSYPWPSQNYYYLQQQREQQERYLGRQKPRRSRSAGSAQKQGKRRRYYQQQQQARNGGARPHSYHEALRSSGPLYFDYT